MLRLLPMLIAGLTVQGEHQAVGTVALSMTIVPGSQLAVTEHPLGDGVTSYVATYDETGIENARHETTEQLAYVGDSVFFGTMDKLAARRYRHDRWPSDISLAQAKGLAAKSNRD